MVCPRNKRALLRAVGLAALVAWMAGCATSNGLRTAHDAEAQQDYDRAIVEYNKLLKARPNDRNLHAALTQAKLRAAQDHFARGRRLAGTGKLEEALVEFQIAGELN